MSAMEPPLRAPGRTPAPPGIVGALGIGGYQLLVDVAGVGAGRLGPQAFLLVAPDPDPALPHAGTQIALHQPACVMRPRPRPSPSWPPSSATSGSRATARAGAPGVRSKVSLVNPATGAVAPHDPRQPPGRAPVRRRQRAAPGCSAPARAFPPPGRHPTPPIPSCCARCCWPWRSARTRSAGSKRSSWPTARSGRLDPPAAWRRPALDCRPRRASRRRARLTAAR